MLSDEMDHDHLGSLLCHSCWGGGPNNDHRWLVGPCLGASHLALVVGGHAAKQGWCLGSATFVLEDV